MVAGRSIVLVDSFRTVNTRLWAGDDAEGGGDAPTRGRCRALRGGERRELTAAGRAAVARC